MTGPEHYREAEEQAQMGAQAEMGSDRERYHLAAAQVHAALALAAATARLMGKSVAEWKEWGAALAPEGSDDAR